MSSSPKEELEWPVERVRSSFINFFVEKHNHKFWPSSPCVPHDDPTLLFTNAGMNQYKPLFLGTCDPNVPMATLKRAVNSQKCIRAGGKHNDLEDVGKDVYHHTMFEMLGNWSFGDYFKEEAITMAWECLTEEFGLNKERLYATYFGGNESAPEDTEARDIWLRFLPKERVLPFDAKDNFWEMGATGPCGPCTEIHYDRIGNRDASKLVNADLPDVIEIWNNVFIQFNREVDGSLRRLPAQHVDTGMGLERLTSILQNKDSNYDTDIFQPIFSEISRVTKSEDTPYQGRVGSDDVGYVDTAYRVIADHIRTLCFAISDGAMPSNDGRGYVLRRILRRAVRYGRQNLNADLGFVTQLVPIVVKTLGNAFPELKKMQALVTSVIQEEEESFNKTLDKGLVKFNELASKCAEEGSQMFSGEDAHFLYTSMGFPVDLTELMLEERGMTLDKDGFEKKMKEEQELSAAAHKAKMLSGMGCGKDMTMEAEQTSALVSQEIAATNDESKYVWNQELNQCIIQALFLGRGETPDGVGFTNKVSSDDGYVGIILDKSSYYAEQGGQINDTGVIKNEKNEVVMNVINVQLYGGFVVHVGTVLHPLSVGDALTCSVDYKRRLPIASNHTMTHVLNYALRDVLITKATGEGEVQQQVDQKGSLVDEFKLRFDFSWNGAISKEQLAQVEKRCIEYIQEKVPVGSYVAPLEQASKISSLRAVFGEVYPDPVRIVAIAPFSISDEILPNPQDDTWSGFSVEFCGGTHLSNTSEIQNFVILQEEGIAKGIRRITAVTMDAAKDAIAQGKALSDRLQHASTELPMDKLEDEIKLLTNEVSSASISAIDKINMRDTLSGLSKKVFQWKKEQAAAATTQIIADIVSLASSDATSVICRKDFGLEGKIAKKIMTSYEKKKCKKTIVYGILLYE